MRTSQSKLVAVGGALLCLGVTSRAAASGIHFAENGARALGQGGAFTAQANDLTAIQHNPAGLAQLVGPQALADLLLLRHDVRFLRTEPGGAQSIAREVENEPGPSVLPFAAGSHGLSLLGRRLTLAGAVYAPPAVGRYHFPTPNYERDAEGDYVENPRRFAPQRYALIRDDFVVVYPSIAAAVELNERFKLGVTLQYVHASLRFSTAITSAPTTPRSILDEQPSFDSVVGIDVGGQSWTGILGVLVQPTDWLTLGASARPPITVDTRGRLDISLGEEPTRFGARVVGDECELTLRFPLELRVGAMARVLPGVHLSADVVYQGWQVFDELVLTPRDVTLAFGGGPEPVEPVRLTKRWGPTLSERLGVSVALADILAVRAGVLVESQAFPDERASVDFFHPSRMFLTAGGEVALGALTLVVVGAFTPEVSLTVQSSATRAASTNAPEVEGPVIGNGRFRSSGWVVGAGLRFGARS